MKDKKSMPPSRRKLDFYESLNLSDTTTNNYRSALQSSFLLEFLKQEFNTFDLFEIVDLDELWQIYSKVNLHPKNINNHRAYSAAIMKYIRYLNKGCKYGKRIDFGKSRLSGYHCRM